MIKLIFKVILIILINLNSFANTRIKDIVSVEGVRDNLLIGYGLVVGLNGSGDNLDNASFTQKGLMDFLERLGINTRGANLKTKNIAAVTVTASLPPFSRQGNKIDVSVSTLGDAKSLQGGTLLATPLLGADGEVYAVAQGRISLNNFFPSAKADKNTNRSVETNGFVQNGAIIEKEIDFDFRSMATLRLSLRNPDMTTSFNIANAINLHMESNFAKAIDPGTVEFQIPENKKENIVTILSEIEQLEIDPDSSAKIVIDEGSGTIVMGDNVRISPVAISQGNLSITIKKYDDKYKYIKKDPVITTSDPGKVISILKQQSTLHDLVEGLNAFGVGPRDLINILQNIKALGALQAEIEIR